MTEENDPRKPQVIKVQVDSNQMKALVEEVHEKSAKIEKLESEVQDSEEAKILFDDMKIKASEQLTNLGIPTEPENIKSKEDLDRAIQTIQKLRAKSESHTGNEGGNAPLSPQQYGTDKSQGYGTHEEMIQDLRERASRGDATAKEALNQLSFKALKGMREIHVEPYQPEPTPTTTSDLSPDLKLAVKPDPMGIEHAFRKKKLIALAERGSKEALEILNSGNY
ncbi:MAG TPA: hypothetical protein VI864_06775 [Candidatus Bathyarchaeia archaeon]|nr:hypothetical protein [Candidatus Bathyarchaeia archaeon]